MPFLEDIKEDIEYRVQKIKDDIKMFGFWKATWYFISNQWHSLFWKHVLNIKRVLEWLPVIWRDRDWDHSYFLTLLKYKLQRMQKELRNGHAVEEHCIERAAEIQEALDIIKQIQDQDFCRTEWTMHKMKYGDIIFNSENEQDGMSRVSMYYEKTMAFEPFNDVARAEAYNIREMEEQQLQAAYNKLFMIIAKNIRGWWD